MHIVLRIKRVGAVFAACLCIVEYEQQGAARAKYGKQVIEALAERLTAEFGRGFSRSNLQSTRTFFLLYSFGAE